jgi:hypothetical protein
MDPDARSIFLFTFISILIGCSKSNSTNSKNSSKPNYYNSFTYTFTDTSGAKYTFTDTTTYTLTTSGNHGDTLFSINGVTEDPTGTQSPAVFILPQSANYIPPYPANSYGFEFIAWKNGGSVNYIIFYLPFFQYNLTRDSLFGQSPLVLVLNGNSYDANHEGDSRALFSINISTTITDSSAGFVSGAFNILAKNSTNKTIQVNGTFDHAPSNFVAH